MATTGQFLEHLRGAVREAVQRCLAEGDLPEAQEGEVRFTTIKALALTADDAVSLEVFTYVYAAAMTGRALMAGWQAYRDWAQWTWNGQVDRVIVALELRQQESGQPTKETPKTAPFAIVAASLGYSRNQRSRMNHPAYRKQGLPITSTYVESTAKQINRRMKGTEKFWSHGVESMLNLVADHFSDTPTLARFWRNRPHHLTGCRCYQSAAA